MKKNKPPACKKKYIYLIKINGGSAWQSRWWPATAVRVVLIGSATQAGFILSHALGHKLVMKSLSFIRKNN